MNPFTHHTVDSWIEEEFCKWRPRGSLLGEAKDIRRAKRWFKQRKLPLEPDVVLNVPREHRALVSRRKRAADAARRIQVHFKVLIDVLRLIDPLEHDKDYLAIQVSNAIHKQQSAGVIAALRCILVWDEAIDWRVHCWWQRPTSHSSKLIIWFRMIDLRELAHEESSYGGMRRRPLWQTQSIPRR